mgnify:CR=1 FL=1
MIPKSFNLVAVRLGECRGRRGGARRWVVVWDRVLIHQSEPLPIGSVGQTEAVGDDPKRSRVTTAVRAELTSTAHVPAHPALSQFLPILRFRR